MAEMNEVRMWLNNSLSTYLYEFAGLDGPQRSYNFGAMRGEICQAAGFGADQDYGDGSLPQVLFVLKAAVKCHENLETMFLGERQKFSVFLAG